MNSKGLRYLDKVQCPLCKNTANLYYSHRVYRNDEFKYIVVRKCLTCKKVTKGEVDYHYDYLRKFSFKQEKLF